MSSAKVPLIVSWPEGLPQNERRNQVVGLTDLGPTMLEALGAPALPNASGRSFWSVTKDPTAPWVDLAFSEYCTDSVPAWTGGMAVQQRMIRDHRWKLCWYHGYRPQLFDLLEDPDETTDLAEDPRFAAVRDRLSQQLLADWDPEQNSPAHGAAAARQGFAGGLGKQCQTGQPVCVGNSSGPEPARHTWPRSGGLSGM